MEIINSPFISSFLVIVGFMSLVYVLALIRDDYSIVDITWGLGFVLISRFTLGIAENPSFDHLVFNLCILIWGLRLAFYLWRRNHDKPEDYRYQEMRRSWGNSHKLQAFFKVFMLQGILLWVIALPIIEVNQRINFSLGDQVWQWLGLALFSFGFVFETIADWQLSVFKKNADNIGKVMQSGLWRYSRHPNYFGEMLVWWGIFLMAIDSLDAGWIVISPILITVLLLKVSGVALLEKKLVEKPKYKDYIDRTNAFIPWVPRK